MLCLCGSGFVRVGGRVRGTCLLHRGCIGGGWGCADASGFYRLRHEYGLTDEEVLRIGWDGMGWDGRMAGSCFGVVRRGGHGGNKPWECHHSTSPARTSTKKPFSIHRPMRTYSYS